MTDPQPDRADAAALQQPGMRIGTLRVEDDGPGVPDSRLNRLGERFFRAPGNRNDGAGRELAIVPWIAELHQASVHYRRAAKQGVSGEIRFPASP